VEKPSGGGRALDGESDLPEEALTVIVPPPS
jgi:hypothetical protein